MEIDERTFEEIAVEEWERIPARFRQRLKNVALLIEDDVDDETRKAEGLGKDGSLLGLYRGIPLTERGSLYGTGMTLPDTITLYRLPILEEAMEMDAPFLEAVRTVVRETVWHEVGHYLGLDEHGVQEREGEGSNRFES